MGEDCVSTLSYHVVLCSSCYLIATNASLRANPVDAYTQLINAFNGNQIHIKSVPDCSSAVWGYVYAGFDLDHARWKWCL